MYREILREIIKDHDYAKLQEPCSEQDIDRAEKTVGYKFPQELRALLGETDGDHWFLMSAKEIEEKVRRDREILSEFLEPDEYEEKVGRHIFFATNGCGDYYCYRVFPSGDADTSCICIWEHELFETRAVAEDIADAIKKYYNDEI